MRILIVETCSHLRDFLGAIIEWPEHAVRLVAGPVEARAAAAQDLPDVLVLCHALDGPEGVALAAELGPRGHPAPVVLLLRPGAGAPHEGWRDLPIVALESPASAQDIRRGVTAAGSSMERDASRSA